MVTCRLQGGLGNNLFQIGATMGAVYDNPLQLWYIPEFQYAYYFKHEFPTDNKGLTVYKEKTFHYEPIVGYNICLDGYFQSAKYFQNNEEEVRTQFEPSDEISEWIDENYDIPDDSCSIHVRRSDYTELQDYHYNLDWDLSYYQEAVLKMGKKTFFVFSDDIEWCKKYFTDAIFINNGDGSRQYGDVLDFFIASRCKSHIIANSSYSWWYSYLSGSKDIIAPKNWFGWKKKDHDTKDLYTKDMLVI